MKESEDGLHAAAREGDLSVCIALLVGGAEINQTDEVREHSTSPHPL